MPIAVLRALEGLLIGAYLLLDDLFRRPSLDLSWNPSFLVVMVVVHTGVFLIFLAPFRVLYSFESLRGSNSALAYEVDSIVL